MKPIPKKQQQLVSRLADVLARSNGELLTLHELMAQILT